MQNQLSSQARGGLAHAVELGDPCSSCGVAVRGANVLYAPDGRIVCPTCFGKLDPNLEAAKPRWRTFALAGAVVGAVPFALQMSSSSFTTVNGQVTSFVYRDWLAIMCGVVALVLGGITVVLARREHLQRALAFAAAIAIVALGAGQIARGVGVFAQPPSSAISSD